MARGEQDRDGAAHRMSHEVVGTVPSRALEAGHQVIGDLLQGEAGPAAGEPP